MFNKLYLKYQFFNKIFINNFYFYNFNFTKSKSELFFYNFNFIFATLNNKKILYYFKQPSIFKNASVTTAWFISKPNINETTVPFYNSWQDLYFSYNNETLLDFDLDKIFNIFFILFLQKNIEIRRIISILIFNKITLKS